MREATLFDLHADIKHDLVGLVEEHGSSLPLGRSATSILQVGKGKEHPLLPTVSRTHGAIVHKPGDTFEYQDSSSNGYGIKRNGKWIPGVNSKMELESGDEIYLSRRQGRGYGPIMFYQGKDEKELNDANATQLVDEK